MLKLHLKFLAVGIIMSALFGVFSYQYGLTSDSVHFRGTLQVIALSVVTGIFRVWGFMPLGTIYFLCLYLGFRSNPESQIPEILVPLIIVSMCASLVSAVISCAVHPKPFLQPKDSSHS